MTSDIDLHAEFYELKGKFDGLSKQVEKLTEHVDALNKTLAQGRGAWLVLFAIPTLVGGVAAILGYFGIRIAVGNH